jgi:hypothetical protein
MRSPKNSLRRHPLLASIALSLVVGALVVVLWPRDRVTRENFAKIRVGMSQLELYQLLGSPGYQVVEIGLVDRPDSYSINKSLSVEAKRQQGFRDYRRQHWTSPKLAISVISDLEGQVVCRYTGPGQKRDWMAFVRDRLFGWFRSRSPRTPGTKSRSVGVQAEFQK